MSTITTEDVEVQVPDGHAVTFHLHRSGAPDAPAVLWLHGSGPGVTALSNWEQLLEELASDYHNLAPDVLGYGRSTHPDPPPNGLGAFTERRAETLVALLDHLGIDRVHLVGNSMGGIISVVLAMRHPERVGRLVLMGTGGAPVPPTAELFQLITFYEDPTAEAMAALMRNFVSDPGFFGDQLQAIVDARLPQATRPEVERSHRATFDLSTPLPITDDAVRSITAPVLLVHGADDKVMPLASSEWYAERLPDARLEVLEGAGHWVQIERHDRFVELVREFLLDA